MSTKNIIIKSVTLLMVGILGMLITNKAIFMHAHKLGDGTIIEHAHPYDKSNDSKPYKSHHHTNAELLFFQNLEILSLIVFLTFVLFSLVKRATYSLHTVKRYIACCIYFYKGRAPPIS